MGKGSATFILGSSTSNYAVNHDLLNIIRVFLTKIYISPDVITVGSESLGPLRLTLSTKRPYFETLTAACSGTVESTACKTGSAKDSQTTNKVLSYDMYREPQSTNIGSPGLWIPEGPRISGDSHSTECLMLAKTWLDDCLREHPKCKIQATSKLPLRVIDVKEGQVRLFVPEEGTRGQWVALSHCWGNANTMKTTLKTIESHKRCIEWESLPQTFKDAILVTRALGVQYLWIDSLCIIQDDGGSDFHAEAAKMSDIYRDSILTVAASCSASDCAGFLRERKVENPVGLDKTRWMHSIRFRQSIDHSCMIRDDPIHSRAWTFQETVLPRRLLSFGSHETSWECDSLRRCECCQIEYGLDGEASSNELGRAAFRKHTRPVVEGRFHLGRQFNFPRPSAQAKPYAAMFKGSAIPFYAGRLLDLAPPCEDPKASQEYIEMARQRTLDNAKELIQPIIRQVHRPDMTPLSLEQGDVQACAEWLNNMYLNMVVVNSFYRYWRRYLVPEFTRRSISKDSDRLIALQSIASDIRLGIQDRYLAGLWQGDLINQLCWQSADGQGLPADNESPSWSWSSIRGPIIPHMTEEFENKTLDVESKMLVIRAGCSLASKNPCGRILNGSIALEASAMEVRCAKNKETGLLDFHAHVPRTDSPVPVSPERLQLEFSPDCPLRCQSDGSLARSAEGDCLDNVTAMLLFVKCVRNLGLCVLVCSLVPDASEANTCHRVGIGSLKELNLDVFSRYIFRQRFVLI